MQVLTGIGSSNPFLKLIWATCYFSASVPNIKTSVPTHRVVGERFAVQQSDMTHKASVSNTKLRVYLQCDRSITV